MLTTFCVYPHHVWQKLSAHFKHNVSYLYHIGYNDGSERVDSEQKPPTKKLKYQGKSYISVQCN